MDIPVTDIPVADIPVAYTAVAYTAGTSTAGTSTAGHSGDAGHAAPEAAGRSAAAANGIQSGHARY